MESKKSILVVDDEPGIVDSIKYILELTERYSVTTSNDAEEAFLKFNNLDFSLVLTDIRMPNKTGLWLMDEIRSTNTEVPIVLMSGYTSTSKEEINGCNYQSFLCKPNDITKIVELVDSLT